MHNLYTLLIAIINFLLGTDIFRSAITYGHLFMTHALIGQNHDQHWDIQLWRLFVKHFLIGQVMYSRIVSIRKKIVFSDKFCSFKGVWY